MIKLNVGNPMCCRPFSILDCSSPLRIFLLCILVSIVFVLILASIIEYLDSISNNLIYHSVISRWVILILQLLVVLVLQNQSNVE